ncbi:MAG: threonylcarbamoyl-AMP synthase [Gammaproteobacteria bacterium]|nr:threonylcarbamoyl-AMP synthase [Gammaproteobacteria bacterium]
MTRKISIHPTDPQSRLLRQAGEALRADGLLIYPTDSTYGLCCRMNARDGQQRMHAVRRDDTRHYLTLVCRDLSSLASHAKVDNQAFRLLKQLTPGPYTFILQASRDIPKRILDPKRRTIGLRIPAHPVAQGLLEELGEPMLSATLTEPGMEVPLADPDELFERYGRFVDLMLDAGSCGIEPTTIIDLSGVAPVLVRRGRGAVDRIFPATD